MAQQVPGIEINIVDYAEKKEKGIKKVIKLNGRIYFAQQRFNSETGESEALLAPLEKKQLESALANLETNAIALRMIIADIDTAVEKLT